MNSPKPGSDPLNELRGLRQTPPPDFVRRVMDALPPEPDAPRGLRLHRLWPEHHRWLLPSLAGAAAMLALMFFVQPRPSAGEARMTVHFELHAPDAETVELVGTFTDWQAGRLRLAGPDASGHWTADVDLPAGRYEYGFLVDGQQWLVDSNAVIRRDDGFGRENAVLAL